MHPWCLKDSRVGALLIGVLLATVLTACGDPGTEPRVVPMASLTLLPATATLEVSGMRQLTAVAKDAAGNVLTGRAFTWTSSDTTVVHVPAGGEVRAVAPGTAESRIP